MATLWKVSDGSTAKLMKSFYGYRSIRKVGKAQALRAAQLSLMTGRRVEGETAHLLVLRGTVRADGRLASNIRHSTHSKAFDIALESLSEFGARSSSVPTTEALSAYARPRLLDRGVDFILWNASIARLGLGNCCVECPPTRCVLDESGENGLIPVHATKKCSGSSAQIRM